MRLRNWNVCAAALKSATSASPRATSPATGRTPDLTALLKLFIANRDEVESVVYGTWWGSLLYRVRHLLNRNSRARQPEEHPRPLRPRQRVLPAVARPDDELQQRLVRRRPQRRPGRGAMGQGAPRAERVPACSRGDRVLEIGCGWGALAEMRGARLRRRRDRRDAVDRAARLGAAPALRDAGAAPADLRCQDYRDIDDGPYDAIVSIEMFEAVGREYWPSYFATVAPPAASRAAGPASRRITIRDDLFERYVRSTDFIQQYIFPGGLLPSPRAFRAEAARRRPAGRATSSTSARTTPRRCAAGASASSAQEARVRRLGFDTPLHAHLGVLPGLLRGRVRDRQHQRHAVHAAARLRSCAPARPGRRAARCCSRSARCRSARGPSLQCRRKSRPNCPAAQLRGQGRLTFFGLHVYDARLWVAPGFVAERFADQPLALELDYARTL